MKMFVLFINTLYKDVLNVFFPIYCASCNRQLFKEFEVLCLTCETALTKTNYHCQVDNPMEKKFWGRCPIEKASALYFYEKKGQVQNLLFHLKYKGNEVLGKHLGMLLAEELKDTDFCKVDIAVPVPLHVKKERLRGYNQVHAFSEGFCVANDIAVSKNNLVRQIENPSQTNRSRVARWSNVEGIFYVTQPQLFKDKKVLLIDDVVTTGATIEACCKALSDAGVEQIYLLSIAVAL